MVTTADDTDVDMMDCAEGVDEGYIDLTDDDIDGDIDGDALDAMEWDAALVEAAMMSLSTLRRDPSLMPSDAHVVGPSPSSAYHATGVGASLLDTPDAQLSPEGAVMTALSREGAAVSEDAAAWEGAATPHAVVTVTVVPDTNVLVANGGASLRVLLERFKTRTVTVTSPDPSTPAAAVTVRARVAVPRKVIQELDGLKGRDGGGGGVGGGGHSDVALFARSVNRAVMRRMEEQQREGRSGRREAHEGELAKLVVQGPADAGAMRVQMRVEAGGAAAGPPSADEEIVYFCQARRRRGEMVAFITGDVNAAVTARSHASDNDVPIVTFDPRDMPADVSALYDEVRGFHAAAAAGVPEIQHLAQQQQQQHAARPQYTHHRHGDHQRHHHHQRRPAEPPPLVPASPSSSAADASASAAEAQPTAGMAGMTAAALATSVLDALNAALPSTVEHMLRVELGDMWAAAVRDDAEDIDSFTPDDAFDALRRNHATLTSGRRMREGRAALDTLARARRSIGGCAIDRCRALEVVAAVREIIEGFPGHLEAVRAAKTTADAAREALMKDRR